MENRTDPYPYMFLDTAEELPSVIEETAHFIKTVIDDTPDVLLFLDRSARPIAWMFKEVWKGLEPSQKSPEIKFINFGIEKGTRPIRSSRGVEYDYDESLLPLWTSQMRLTFQKDDAGLETFFDNKSVLIVDDFSSSGKTLALVKRMLEPVAQSAKTTAVYHSLEPCWLRASDLIGVQDIDRASLLVTRNTSPKSMLENAELRAELRAVAHAVTRHMVSYATGSS